MFLLRSLFRIVIRLTLLLPLFSEATVLNVGFLSKNWTDSVGRLTSNEVTAFEWGIQDANELFLRNNVNLQLNLTTKILASDDGKSGARAAIDFISANSSAIFVGTISYSCASLAVVSCANYIPTISPTGCTDAGFTDRNLYPTFATLLTSSAAAVLLKDFLVQNQIKNLQIISNLDFKEIGLTIQSFIEGFGISVPLVQSFQVRDSLAVKRLAVSYARASGHRCMLVIGTHSDVRDVFIEFDEAGMDEGFVFLQYGLQYDQIEDPSDTPERNAAAKRAIRGSFGLQQYFLPSKAYTDFAMKIWNRTCESPEGCQPKVFNDQTFEYKLTPPTRTYDSVMVFATNLLKVMSSNNSATLSPKELSNAAFKLMTNSVYKGIVSTVAFTPNAARDPLPPSVLINARSDGSITKVGTWSRPNGTVFYPVELELPGGLKEFPPQFLIPDDRRFWERPTNVAAIFAPIGFVVSLLLTLSLRFYVKARMGTKKRRGLEMARLEDAAQAANTERDHAEIANQNKRKFLRYMMHELRVPFHVLEVGLQSLEEERDELPSEARGTLSQMRDASEMMSGIMEDALNLQRIEDGRFEVSIAEFDPVKMIEYVLHAHSLRARDHELRLQLHADEASRSVLISSDEIRLRQCLSNLVDNAIKFSPDKGAIDVFLRIESGSGEVTIGVRDQGPGISLADREKLFQAWSQINAGVLQNGKGSGLGLSLVKMMMELIGGECRIEPHESGAQGGQFTLLFKTTVTAKSKPEVAAFPIMMEEVWLAAAPLSPQTLPGTLNVIVPHARGAPRLDIPTPPSTLGSRPVSTVSMTESRTPWTQQPSTRAAAPAEPLSVGNNASTPTTPSRASGMRVLVVDDVAMVRSVMTRLLQQKGAVVETAENGAIAVEISEKTGFDFVLMDKEMPVMDGYEACRIISPRLPTFGVTGNALEEELAEFSRHGALEVFKKPLKFELLEQALEKHNIQPKESQSQSN